MVKKQRVPFARIRRRRPAVWRSLAKILRRRRNVCSYCYCPFFRRRYGPPVRESVYIADGKTSAFPRRINNNPGDGAAEPRGFFSSFRMGFGGGNVTRPTTGRALDPIDGETVRDNGFDPDLVPRRRLSATLRTPKRARKFSRLTPSRHFRVSRFVAGRRLYGTVEFLVQTQKTERRRFIPRILILNIKYKNIKIR